MKNINIDKLFDQARLEQPGIAREDIKNILQNGGVSNYVNYKKFANKTGFKQMATIGSLASAGALSIALLVNAPKLEKVIDNSKIIKTENISQAQNNIAENVVSNENSKELLTSNESEIRQTTNPEVNAAVKAIDLSNDELKNIGVSYIENGDAIFYSKDESGAISMTKLSPEGILVQSIDSLPNGSLTISPTIITDESGRSKFKVSFGKFGDNKSNMKGMFFCSTISNAFNTNLSNQKCMVMKFKFSANPDLSVNFSTQIGDSLNNTFSSTENLNTSKIMHIGTELKPGFNSNFPFSFNSDFQSIIDALNENNANIPKCNDLLNRNDRMNFNTLILNDSIQSKFLNSEEMPKIIFQNMSSNELNGNNMPIIKIDSNNTITIKDGSDSAKKNENQLTISISDYVDPKIYSIKTNKTIKLNPNRDTTANNLFDNINLFGNNKFGEDFSFINLTPIKIITGSNNDNKRTYFIWINPNANVISNLPKKTATALNSELQALEELKSDKNIQYETLAQKGKALKGGYFDLWNSSEGALSGFTVYPNPSYNKTANLKFKLNEDRKLSASIYDLKGVKIKDIFKNSAFKEAEINQEIDLRGLSSGIYVIELVTELGEKVSQRIIVE